MTLEVDAALRLGAFRVEARFTAGAGLTALFGRSGAGKTTLVNMIGGLARPERGRITVNDTVLFDSELGIDLPPRRRRVGYVFQEGRLFPHMTVAQNLAYGRWFTPARERYVDEGQIVALLGLGPLLGRRPGALSGGEKQRVAIGRALLASPRLLLMDEPLSSLDEARKNEILPYIERLRDELGVPIVYVSHSIDEVVRLATTLVVLAGGRVVAAGPLGDVTTRLDLEFLVGRPDAGAVVDAQVAAHDPEFCLTTLDFPGGRLHVPQLDRRCGASVRVRIRARDVAISTARPDGLSVQNVVAPGSRRSAPSPARLRICGSTPAARS